MRLYSMEQVLAAEADPSFSVAQDRARASAVRALAAHQAKLRTAKALAWEIPITIPDISPSDLRANARDRLATTDRRQLELPIGFDDLVAAAAVQMIMEACEPALWALDEMFATPGVRAARVIVRKRILSMTAVKHPWLRNECVRRFRAETGSIEPAAHLFEVA
ncbi:MAG: hypothetical protein AB1768_17750 [Pseudomonadota bacterium]|jgi:hypothetical protein